MLAVLHADSNDDDGMLHIFVGSDKFITSHFLFLSKEMIHVQSVISNICVLIFSTVALKYGFPFSFFSGVFRTENGRRGFPFECELFGQITVHS